MNSKVREVLVQARKLIETPDTWAQGRSTFHYTDIRTGERRVAFCAVGAVEEADGYGDEAGPGGAALRILAETIGGHIPTFNDRHTHAEVLEAFDRAIEAAGVR